MIQEDYQQLEGLYLAKIRKVDTKVVRYLYEKINWDARLIGIKGARGVGKTTLLLQRIKLAYKKMDNVFYVSVDNLWFQSHSLPELVDWLYQHGIRNLFLDEVHKYPDWAIVIKNLYDTYDDLRIVYTGSSMLEIDHSRVDLSRRQTLYTLQGLSFREYLAISKVKEVSPMGLTQLFEEHQSVAMDISRDIPVAKYFEEYLRNGYYPFYKEAGNDYMSRLNETAVLVMETDIPAVESISYTTIQKTKQLLMLIAGNVPLVPNISKLSAQLETTRDSCLKMLYTLDRAGLLQLLTRNIKDYKHLVSPEKIFLGNTNLMYALGSRINEGTLRETFFLNQLSLNHDVNAPSQGDFLVDNKYLFEVGGKNKTFEQIKDMQDSFLAVDDTEVGSRNRIPLWMFGLLY